MRHRSRSSAMAIRLLVWLVPAVALGTACSDKSPIGGGPVVRVRIIPATLDLLVGQTDSLRATPLDANNAFIVGQTTVWSSANPAAVLVDANGAVTGVALGSSDVSALVDGVTGTITVTVSPAPAINLSAASATFSATAAGADPASQAINVTNSGGQALTDLAVGTVVYGAGATGWLTAQLDQAAAPAVLTLQPATAGLAPGSYTATVPVTSAASSNSPQNVDVTFNVNAGAPTQITRQSLDPQTAVAGQAVAVPPQVLVRDANNFPVKDVIVSFAATAGGGLVAGGTDTTDVNGLASVGSWTLGTVAGVGNNTLTASAGALAVNFTATAIAGAPTQIARNSLNNQAVVVNTAVTVPPQVLVRDVNNNPVPGVQVVFQVASGGGSVTGGTDTTDAFGLAQVGSWTLGTTAGTNTLNATATPGTVGNNPATFTATGLASAANVSPTLSTVTALPAALTASNGSSAATITVTARDTFGNLIDGAAVILGASGSGNTLTQPGGVTVNGVATGSLSSTGAGSKTITATVSGTVLAQTPVVTVSPAAVSAAQSSVAVSPGSITASNGASASTITVTARDGFNNPISLASVVLAANPAGGNTLTQPGSTTDISGVATGSLSSTVAGGKTVSATISGTAITQTQTVTVNASSPTSVTVTAGNNQATRVGTTIATAPQVTVQDAFSNLVSGATVNFAVVLGGGVIGVSSSTTTGGTGVAVFPGTWTVSNGGGSATRGTYINTMSATSGTGSATVTDSAFYSFSLDVTPIFTANFCTSGCHGYPFSRANIVNVGASTIINNGNLGCGTLVIPSDAVNSFLMKKLDSNQNCGGVMPPGGPQLPAATRQIVRDWINRNAQPN